MGLLSTVRNLVSLAQRLKAWTDQNNDPLPVIRCLRFEMHLCIR